MRVIIEYDDNSLSLSPGDTIIGRGVTCSLRFNDPAISRKHARIEVKEDKVFLEDLGTTNGTQLNNERISGTRILANGDQITIGRRMMRIRILADVPSEDEFLEDTTADHDALIAEMARKGADAEHGALLVISDFSLRESAPPKVVHQNCPGCGAKLTLEASECPACGHRLRTGRSLAPTLEIRTDQLERRTKPRRLVNIPCLYTSESLTFESHATDFSNDGLFITCDFVDEIGTPCHVTLLPDGQPPRSVVGVVSRVVEGGRSGARRGMGIRFSTMTR
jgi:hypothetical protein